MKTLHRVMYGDSARVLKEVPPESVDLVVTSPPYPMVEMWDELFGHQDRRIKSLLEKGEGDGAQKAMHESLDMVWRSLDPKMKRGSMACINVGDSTRTMSGSFKLYPNHARVISSMTALGYDALPEILWRKRSNKPNKFLGSGMLPAGAYVTQEHEYILIFRKGGKREFLTGPEKAARSRSAYFWEERNSWFSDVWDDVRGERQGLGAKGPRARSGAYPFELAYRLVSMFSVRGDTVLDPFAGTAVTTLAAIAGGRNSTSIEVDGEFRESVERRVLGCAEEVNEHNLLRLKRHLSFAEKKGGLRYRNEVYGFPVMTRQETALELPLVSSVKKVSPGTFEVQYSDEGFRLDLVRD
ncbi:MAG: site-specific DNA-methyltransferase [Nitrososphaerota archaeon]|nr:site-specific DNA-methyltransferase [Nitrososphaerota archaeon]